MRISQWVSMSVCVLFGFAYLAWLAWVEGVDFWAVAGLMAAFGAIAFLAHRIMGAKRQS